MPRSRLLPLLALVLLASACDDPMLVEAKDDAQLLPPNGEQPSDETPGDETPGDETPGDETPGDETPGDETPGDETPDPTDPPPCEIAECGSWRQVTVLAEARSRHTATKLLDGRVLIAGGQTEELTPSCEIYDPETESFVPAAPLGGVRYDHEAVLLLDGRVLVMGGFGESSFLDSAEVYDPALDLWSPVGSLAVARASHTATLLPDGSVVVVGGINGTMEAAGQPARIERFVPGQDTFVEAGYLNGWRYLHAATALADGSVYIAGGFRSPTEYPTETLLVDTATVGLAFATGAAMPAPRRSHTATLLPTGDVLIAGGYAQAPLQTALLFVAEDEDYRAGGALTSARYGHTATALSSGEVLLAGGVSGGEATVAAELYDGAQEAFVAVAPMHEPRHSHTSTRLDDGSVLVVGGSVAFEVLGGAEIFTP